MEWILNIIHYVIPFLVLLGVLVFVHEFGHFIVARSLGVSVSAFSIGFGKELWSRTDKKGTVWKISAIPLGGYCQFLGDADESSSTSDVDLSKYTEEEQKHLFATQTPYKKLAIAKFCRRATTRQWPPRGNHLSQSKSSPLESLQFAIQSSPTVVWVYRLRGLPRSTSWVSPTVSSLWHFSGILGHSKTVAVFSAVTGPAGAPPYFFSEHKHYRHRSLCEHGPS